MKILEFRSDGDTYFEVVSDRTANAMTFLQFIKKYPNIHMQKTSHNIYINSGEIVFLESAKNGQFLFNTERLKGFCKNKGITLELRETFKLHVNEEYELEQAIEEEKRLQKTYNKTLSRKEFLEREIAELTMELSSNKESLATKKTLLQEKRNDVITKEIRLEQARSEKVSD